MKAIVLKLSLLTRTSDWRFSFVPFIVGCFYLWFFLFKIQFNISSLQLFLMLLMTTIGFASLGYLINDYFDKEADKIAGKINRLALLKAEFQILLFIASSVTAFLPWLRLPFDTFSGLLIFMELIFFLLYSLPFPRLKNLPYLSGIIDSFYAYVIPLLLIFHTCSLYAQQALQLYIVFFAIGVFFIGYRNIIIHQVKDMVKDKQSGILTLPQKIGSENINFLLLLLLILEIFFLLLSSFLIAKNTPFFFFWVVFYLLFVAIRFYQINSLHKTKLLVWHLTDVLYQLWFPLIALLLAITIDFCWILLMPFHIILLIPSYRLEKLKEWFTFAKSLFQTYIFIPYISRIVNYSIYHFFLLFGVNLKKENQSALKYLKKKLRQFYL